MRKFFFILIFVLSSFKGATQNFADKKYYLLDSFDLTILKPNELQLIDSCLSLFHDSKSIIIKIGALNYIVEECYNEDVWPKYNNYIYNLLVEEIKKCKSNQILKELAALLATSVHNKAYYFNEQGNFKKALKNYELSLKINEQLGSEAEIGEALNYLGFFHKKHGNIPEAVEYYHKSLKIREKIGDKEGASTNLNNLGVIYLIQNNSQLSLEYFSKSLKIRQEIEFKFGIAESLNNIGYLYQFYGDPLCNKNRDTCLLEGTIKALDYYNKSLIIREEIKNKKEIAMSLNNIGAIYDDIGEPSCNLSPKICKEIGLQKAMEYYQRSLKLREEANDKIGVGISYNNIGGVYLKLGDRKNAKEYITKALSIYQKMGSPENIGNSSNLLADIYEQENKGMQALEMYKVHIKMRDSLNNDRTQKASIEQKTKYEYDKQKVLDDAQHDKQLAIEKEAKAKQKVITYAVALGLFLVGLFLIFVFNRLQITKKQKVVIEKQKTIVEKAHHELEEKNKEITDSIQYAKRIQNAILPPTKLVKEYLPQSFILYKPKDIVAGDFYWMEHKNGKILFAAADCTGHGVPGAMVSVVCNNGLNRSVREYGLTEPGKILDKTREIVIQEFEKSDEEVKDGMDISLCELDTKNNTLSWSGANNPLWIIRNNEILEYKPDKQPIGKYMAAKPFFTHEIELQKGDSIYIFTDGYQDQFGGEKGKKFKTTKLRELLLTLQHQNMEKQREILDSAFENWKGDLEQVDDVCVIGVKI